MMTLPEFFQNVTLRHHAIGLVAPRFEEEGFSLPEFQALVEKLGFLRKEDVTEDFLKHNPDIFFLQPEKKNIKKDHIDALHNFCEFPASYFSQRLVVINGAHGLTASSANALLKLLEEPPHPCIFFLLFATKSGVPQTILSRLITFHIADEQNYEIKTLDSEDEAFLESFFAILGENSVFHPQIQEQKLAPLSPQDLTLSVKIFEISEIFAKKYETALVLDRILAHLSKKLKKDQSFLPVGRFMMQQIRNFWERKEFHMSAVNGWNQFFLGFALANPAAPHKNSMPPT